MSPSPEPEEVLPEPETTRTSVVSKGKGGKGKVKSSKRPRETQVTHENIRTSPPPTKRRKVTPKKGKVAPKASPKKKGGGEVKDTAVRNNEQGPQPENVNIPEASPSSLPRKPSRKVKNSKTPTQSALAGEQVASFMQYMKETSSRLSSMELLIARLSAPDSDAPGHGPVPVSVPLDPPRRAPVATPEGAGGRTNDIPSHPPPVQRPADGDASGSGTASVSFAIPQVVQAGVELVPEGWSVWKDGMAFGEEPGSLVFPDGVVLGPGSVEIDSTSHIRPIWRYRTLRGTKAKTPKGMIPVREAYESLFSAFVQEPLSATEWDGPSFPPPGSSTSRAIVIDIGDASLSAAFLRNDPDWFEAIARGGKFAWDEATGPTNLVPRCLDCFSSRDFARFFAAK